MSNSVSNINHTQIMRKFQKLQNGCTVEMKSVGTTTRLTVFNSQELSRYKVFTIQLRAFFIYTEGIYLKKDWFKEKRCQCCQRWNSTVESNRIKLRSVYSFHYQNLETRHDLKKLKAISLLKIMKLSISIQIKNFVYRFVLEKSQILHLFQHKSRFSHNWIPSHRNC